ncbi:MAG: DNA glycosylase [Actinomycetota bacterium]|nr:DNA glycosylase [Actinomycetota bacterium]
MPEGDTVWLTARRLDQALRHRAVTRFELRVPQLAIADLRGAVVTQVLARGKHLLMRFDHGTTLHSHLRMDGSWHISHAGRQPHAHPEHMIRAIVANADWAATGFRVHDLRLVATLDEASLVGHLGPDLLGPDWCLDEATRRLLAAPERALADALLDQANVAGIGNMYLCEVLFCTRANPWSQVGDVTDVARVLTTVQRLMLSNREHPAQSTTGLLGVGREHWVYRRAGQPCLRCRSAIRSAPQGPPGMERTRYWCPSCQPR